MPVSGEVPVLSAGPVTTVITEDFVYVYGETKRNGGQGGEGTEFDIYEFATSSGVFRHLPVTGIRPRPRHSLRGWSHENKLYFFAGCLSFGDDKNGNYLVAPEKAGMCDNLLAEFDLGTNVWRSVDTKGPRPSPRAGYAAAKSGDHVFIHGGFGVVKHEFHVLDMTTKTWTVIANDVPPSFRWRSQIFHHSLTAATEKRLFIVGVFDNLSNKVWQFYLEGCFWEDLWKEEKSLHNDLQGHLTVVIEKQNGLSLVSLGGSQRDTNTHTNTDTENTQMIIVDIE